MLPHIDADIVEVVADEELESRLLAVGPRDELDRGGMEGRDERKQLIAFARMDGDQVFPGYSWRELRSGKHQRRNNGVLCHTAVEIQSAVGCAFNCTYCPYTSFLCVRLDIEEFVARVARLARERRSQSLFKLNNRTDTLGLEPEYGLSRALVERFAGLDGSYLLLYSKGDEVDSLVDLDHAGKTIASFTLTPEPIASLLETGAPSPAARLAAIGKLARAGYPIRVRFSPIVPLRGWRLAYRDLIERLYAVARPEMITMWTLSMVNVEDLMHVVPLEQLDDEALSAARAAASEMRGLKGAPFPAPFRAAMYREIASLVRSASETTAVTLCLETPEVWDAVSSLVVTRRGGAFLCNCGPRATSESLARLRRHREA